MTDNKKKVAVIGFGGMGRWHVRHLLKSDVAKLTGIYDIDPAKYDIINTDERYTGVSTYASLEDVLSDESVDIVTIAVPNDSHAPIALAAMKAGKNVICEKPVCMNSKELAEIYSVSEETGKLFTVHQNRRWDNDYLMIKELYASGELGEVFNIESRVLGSHGIPGDWRGHKKHGGGMMLDWGVHLIDQMLGIVYDKKIERVYCHCEHVTNDEVDDGFKLDLYFEGGLVARIEVGTSHFIKLPRYFVNGSNGSALVETWNCDARVVCCKDENDRDVVPVVTAAGLTKTMAPRSKESMREYTVPCPKVDVHDFYRNFCLAIDGKAEQIVTHAQVMRVMKIMEAALKSDRLRAPVDLDEVSK